MTTNVTRKMQSFLWDSFVGARVVGTRLDDLLSWPELGLTEGQISSVEKHYYKPDEWTEEDEKVRDIVATATDNENSLYLYHWLAWAVGDEIASYLVAGWENE